MADNENINKNPDVSWVIVDKWMVNNESEQNNETRNENEINGVQELIEDDLGSNESDDISIISESELNINDTCTCSCSSINNTIDDETEILNVLNNDNSKIECDINNESEFTRKPVSMIFDELSTKQVNFNYNNNVLTFSSIAGVFIVFTYLISYYNTTITYETNDVIIEDFDETYDLWTDNNHETCNLNIDSSDFNTDINNNFMQCYNDIDNALYTPVIMETTKLPANTENKKIIYQNNEKSRNSNNKNHKKVKNKKNRDNQKIKIKRLRLENYMKKKEKYHKKRAKFLEKIDKYIANLESKFQKLFNGIRKNEDFLFWNEKYEGKKSKKNSTGDWYQKMFYGRSEMRHKEKLSEWMFERAKMRNKLRDEAFWYFNWANGREEIRSSVDVRSGKRHQYKNYQ